MDHFAPSAAKSSRNSPEFRILLIEDNPGDVFLLEESLRESQIQSQLAVAESGSEAIALIDQYGSAGDEIPHLIVMDLNIPQYDGAEILQRIRSDARLTSVPVVVLTSSDSPKDRAAAAERGADLYLRKPTNLDDFLGIGRELKRILAAPVNENTRFARNSS